MQSVLITGANGFIGSYLTHLLRTSYTVFATGKGPSRLPVLQNVSYHSLDYTDKMAVSGLFDAVQPQVVIHAGAISKPDECEMEREKSWRINVSGTENMLQAAAKEKSFFVFISTDFVFNGEKGNYVETDATSPVNYYGETKLAAEKRVVDYPGGWSIVRPILVYGHPRGGRENILTTVAKGLREGKPQRIFDDQSRMPTYVEDLTAAIQRMIDLRATGVFHICGKDILSPYEMAVAAARFLHLDEHLIRKETADSFSQPARRPPKTGFDLTKAKTILGYDPVSFEEGLQRTFDQYADMRK